MKIASYSNRIGGFVSFNNGIIQDCYTDAKVKHPCNAAGFAFENSGKIEHAVAKNQTYGKENIAGFCCRNKGSITESGWLLPKGGIKKSSYLDVALAIEYERYADIAAKLKLGGAWCSAVQEADASLELNESGNTYVFAKEEQKRSWVEIGSAEELIAIAKNIAGGDKDASDAYYKLTCDINLHGKKWLPIGLTDTTPFTGIFDGAGYRIHNFKIQGKGLDFAGFFGYIKVSA